jgi:hypothetical protein
MSLFEYILELSGGFRTFGVTWAIIRGNIIEPNGGLNNFRICMSSTVEHPNQVLIGKDIAKNNNFYHANFRQHNHSKMCAHYGYDHDCPIWRKRSKLNFAIQWMSVRMAHSFCSANLSDTVAAQNGGEGPLFIRLRPDFIVNNPINLTVYGDMLRERQKNLSETQRQYGVSLPICGASKGHFVHDFTIFATAKAMNRYAFAIEPHGRGRDIESQCKVFAALRELPSCSLPRTTLVLA